jgi:hypothetical protein
MPTFSRVVFLALWIGVVSGPVGAQRQSERETLPDPSQVRMPNGKSQQEEIIKADHERSIKDAAQLIELSESLKQELEKDDRHVLSISSLKKTEEIEKVARRIRSRLKRF